jgi:hypothetical protein
VTVPGASRVTRLGAPAVLAACTAASVLLSRGSPALAVLPPVLFAVGWWTTRAPLRGPTAALLLAALVASSPERVGGVWPFPLAPLSSLLFDALRRHVPLPFLRCSLLDLAVTGLLLVAAARRATGSPLDRGGPPPARAALDAALLAGIGALLAAALGLARGGDPSALVFQLRPLLLLPAASLLFLAAFRGPEDHALVGRVVLAAALVKAAVVVWFRAVVAPRLGVAPEAATSHGDTVLFVLALAILVALWHERRTAGAAALLALAGALVLAGIDGNARRLAWAALAAVGGVLFLRVPWTAPKRLAARAAVAAIPLAVVYLAAGWGASARVFAPVQLVRSMVDGEHDRSTWDRDVENYNLVATFRAAPLLGTGLGHPYRIEVRGDDISHAFPMWQFFPHNALLGALAFTGVLGFFLGWAPILAGLFLALRSYPRARGSVDRTAALGAVAALVAFLLQAWGDMGLYDLECVLLAALGLATAARLAVAVGAWPVPAATATGAPSPAPPATAGGLA